MFELKLPILTPKQQLIHDCKARFRTVCGQRRWGQTYLAMVEAIENLVVGKRVCWVAGQGDVMKAWCLMKDMLKGVPDLRLCTARRQIELENGQINFWDGNRVRPESFRGRRYDLAILTEVERWGYNVSDDLDHGLRPTLVDTKGRGLVMSHTNYQVRAACLHGVDQPERVQHFVASIDDNPHLSDEDKALIRTHA